MSKYDSYLRYCDDIIKISINDVIATPEKICKK